MTACLDAAVHDCNADYSVVSRYTMAKWDTTAWDEVEEAEHGPESMGTPHT